MSNVLKSRLAYYLGDIVYGANDGIITTFAVVSAAAGAGFSSLVIVVLGIANLIADGFSMGASRYLSLTSEQSLEGGGNTERNPFADGAATFLAFIGVGFLPLIPFLVVEPGENTFGISAIATAAALFLVGAARALVTTRGAFVSGLEMLTVGGIAAAIAYFLGAFVQSMVAGVL